MTMALKEILSEKEINTLITSISLGNKLFLAKETFLRAYPF